MPSLKENLWNAVSAKNYDEAAKMIVFNSEENLVNPNPENPQETALLMHLISLSREDRAKAMNLIEVIVTHPRFNPRYQEPKKTQRTYIDQILMLCADDVLLRIINTLTENQRSLAWVLLNKNKLTLETAQTILDSTNKIYELYAKSKNLKGAEVSRLRSERYKKIVEVLTDATVFHADKVEPLRDTAILYAIKKNDADLFNKLGKSGVGTSDKLESLDQNKDVGLLMTKDNVKTKEGRKQMLTPKENVWDALLAKDYNTAEKMIVTNPQVDLVNLENPQGTALLMHIISLSREDRAKAMSLVDVIVTHPHFNPLYQEPKKPQRTYIDRLLVAGADDVLLRIINTLEENQRPLSWVFLNKDKLTLETAQTMLDSVTRIYNLSSKNDKDLKLAELSRLRVEGCKKITEVLRDATVFHAIKIPLIRDALILYAIKTDDPDLFDRLEKAGDRPSARLSNDELPLELLTNNNFKLKAWYADQAVKRDQDFIARQKTAGQAMHLYREYDAKLKEADLEYKQTVANIYLNAVNERAERLERAIEIVRSK